MAPVELSRLKPQINALMLQHEDCDRFVQFLVAFLEDYRDRTKPHFINKISILPTFNIPPIVKSELDSAFAELALNNRNTALPIADALWVFNSFETKIFSVGILANLKSPDHRQLVDRLAKWIDPRTDQVLVSEILNQCTNNLEILKSDLFFRLIAHWLRSPEKEIKKVGIKSISLILSNKNFTNIPKIFNLLDLAVQKPDLQIQSDLLSVIRTLIDCSQAETASFLFSRYQLSTNEEARIFIRKCIPYLEKYYLNEFESRFQ